MTLGSTSLIESRVRSLTNSQYINVKDELKYEFEINSDNLEIITAIVGEINLAFREKSSRKIHINEEIWINNFPIQTRIKLGFENCVFHKRVTIKLTDYKEQISFVDCVFMEDLIAMNCKFNNLVNVRLCTFKGRISFHNSEFNNILDFSYSKFEEDQYFAFIKINSAVLFSNSIFKQAIKFDSIVTLPSATISFDQAIFHKGIDISLANFTCNLQFWKIQFENINLKEWTNSKAYYMENGIENVYNEEFNNTLYKRFRESFRIIKHTFEKQGNNLDKHYLTRLEMKAYSKELWFKYPLLKKVPDKLILLLNYLSNNHGQNWIVGVLFTLGVTIISFIWIIEPIDNGIEFNLSYKNITKTINYNAQLMNITNWSFEAFGISYDKTSYTKLFISKIFITYGYYQTISAFRKFNRK